MRRQLALQRQLRSLERLGNAIGAMKSLAAHHVRSAKNALDPARSYRSAVEDAVARSGVTFPSAGQGGELLVVIGAELGLCGPYNARIAAYAANHRLGLEDGPTFCMGRRTATLLERQGLRPDKVYPAPASVQGVTDTLLSAAEDVFGAYLENELRSVVLVGARFRGVGAYEVTAERLLPVEANRAGREQRFRYVSQSHLADVALREMLFVQLYEQLLDSLASEHGARLAATQRAHSWLEERRERVSRQLSSLRREASTQETVEIAAGAKLHRRP